MLSKHLRALRIPSNALVLCLATAVLLAVSPLRVDAAVKPVKKQLEKFFGNPEVGAVLLSPDGAHLAIVNTSGAGVIMQLVETCAPFREKDVLLELDGQGASLGFLNWVSETRLVYSLRRRNREDIYAINADASQPRRLLSNDEIKGELTIPDKEGELENETVIELPRRLRCLGLDPQNSESLLVEASGMPSGVTYQKGLNSKELEVSVYRVNTSTGVREKLNETILSDLPLYDRQGTPRFISRQSMEIHEKRLEPISKADREAFSRLGDVDHLFSSTPENVLKPRMMFLGFGEKPSEVYYASNAEHDSLSVYKFDMESKEPAVCLGSDSRDLVPFDLPPGENGFVVWDRHTGKLAGLRIPGHPAESHWFLPRLATVQKRLAEKHGRPEMRILDWDKSYSRFLTYSESPDEPGRYFVYEAETGLLIQVAKRNATLSLDTLGRTKEHHITTKDGHSLEVFVTDPPVQKLKHAPVVVMLWDSPCDTVKPVFRGEVQAFSSMGFIVLQVGHRGMPGYGLRHFSGLAGAPDQKALDDIEEALKWLSGIRDTDKRRVVLFGCGFGGYLAVRALEIRAETYRCVIAVDPVFELGDVGYLRANLQKELSIPGSYQSYFATDPETYTRARRSAGGVSLFSTEDYLELIRRASYATPIGELNRISATKDFKLIGKPVLLVNSRSSMGIESLVESSIWKLLKKKSEDAEQVRMSTPYERASSRDKANLFMDIAGFLNDNLFNYEVNVGTPEVQR